MAMLDLIYLSELIATHQFSEAMAGLPVSIDLQEKIESAIREALPSRPTSLSAYIGKLLTVLGSGQLTEGLRRIHTATEEWHRFSSDRLATPPGLALMALLAANAREMREDDALAENNFYGRMAETASTELVVAEFGSIYRDIAWDLWRSLVDWLDAWEGERGNATVTGVSNYRTLADLKNAEKFWAVNLAISQVDLRETERNNLEQMFTYYGMDPGFAAPIEVMRSALNDWITDHRYATAHLKKLWRSHDRRPAIIDAANKHLTKWDGADESLDPSDTSGASEALRLRARLNFQVSQNAFKRRVSLRLALRHRDPINGSLFLSGVSQEDGMATTSASITRREVSLGKHIGGVSEFDDPDGQIARALVGVRCDLTVEHRDGAMTVTRPPRPLLPFRLDEPSGKFQETERLSLGVHHALLLYTGSGGETRLAEWTRRLLDNHATRPKVTITGDESRDIPLHWTYFGDFVLESVPEMPEPVDAGDELTSVDESLLLDLEPFRCAAIATLNLSGGLRIPGRHRARWLCSRPPVITVVVPDAREGIALEIADNQQVLRTLAVSGPSMTLLVEELDLSAGHYSAALRRGRQSLMLERFRLVNAETPSRYSAHRSRMGHDVSRPETRPMISACTISDDALGGHTWLDGLSIADDVRDVTFTSRQTPPVTPGWADRADDPLDTSSPETALTAPCFHGGHYRIGPKIRPPGTPKPKDQRWRCKFCKRYWPAERTRAPKRSATTRRVVPAPPARRTPIPSSMQATTADAPRDQLDFSPVFEAMCHLREGSIDDLRALVLGVGGDNLDLHEVLDSLHALGHCEVEYDKDMRPADWQITPTTLVSVTPGHARIVGFRSSSFSKRITELSKQLGIMCPITDIPGLPQCVKVETADVSMLQNFANSLYDESSAGYCRLYQPDLVRLVWQIPPMSMLESHLPRSSQPPARILEHWDHGSTKWVKTDNLQLPGAYRFAAHKVVYGWQPESTTDGNREFLIGTHSIVKHLEARRQKRPLLYYDPIQNALCVRQGAGLPPLLHRIATTASGHLPTPDLDAASHQRILRYDGITTQLASAIYDRMMT
jgi:hypothetical protein